MQTTSPKIVLVPFLFEIFIAKRDYHAIFFSFSIICFQVWKDRNSFAILISMNVICIEEKAFYALWDRMFKYVRSQMEMDTPDKWIDKKEAKRLLRIKSDTTLQKLRDEGQIRYSQPERKHILYDRDSINDYLEAHVMEPFNNK